MKKVILKTIEAVANHGGAMEADTINGEHSRITKHGRNLKSQTSKVNY